MSILVRQIAKKNRVNDKIRDEIVTKHVKAGNTSTKTVMQELSGYWSSALSHLVHAALKSQLFRANLKENPRPPIPYTHEDFMSLDLPTMFTQTADGKRFLDKRGLRLAQSRCVSGCPTGDVMF